MMQLNLFTLPADPLAEALISKGYAPNHYLLRLNRSIEATYGDLPSRLFQNPIEFVGRDRQNDGKSKLWLRHPDFEGLPILDQIERETGARPYWSPVDEFGRPRTIGMLWHAIDLLTDEHFEGMLATRNFTDKSSVVNGLRYHMEFGGLSVANARTVLAEYGCAEPDDRSAGFLHSDAVKVANCQSGKFVAMWTKDEQSVWAAIHGLEDGLFKRDRNGHLRFSAAFLAEKEADREGKERGE